MAPRKQYTSVSKMVQDLTGDEQFCEELDERIARRQIVKHLVALRAVKGVSQDDVAKALKVTQSRVSKIENGVDDDLRLGDLKGYMKALNMDVGLVFGNQNRTTVDEVKYHAFQLKRLLTRLAKLAEKDEGIAYGVANFFGEAFFNLVRIMQDSATELPKRAKDGKPLVQIHIQELETAGEPGADNLNDETVEACSTTKSSVDANNHVSTV